MTQATTTDALRIEPLHEVQDEAKYNALVKSMEADGWVGAEVVIIEREDGDPLAITGSHRIAAARSAEIDVPTVDLADLLAEHGANLAELIAEYEDAGFSTDDATYEVVTRLYEHLPRSVREHYGLDAH